MIHIVAEARDPKNAQKLLDEYKKKIESGRLPDYVKARADEELERRTAEHQGAEAKARAEDTVEQLTSTISKLEASLDAAHRSGDERAVKDAEELLKQKIVLVNLLLEEFGAKGDKAAEWQEMLARELKNVDPPGRLARMIEAGPGLI